VRKYLFLSLFLVIADQATKLAIRGFDLFGIHHEGMYLYESVQVIPGSDLLRWTLVENPGMAFGLNFGMPVVLSLFSLAASIFLITMLRQSKQQESTGLALALALILAGAFGNLIDRMFYGVFYGYAGLFYGKVVDFIDVDLPDLNFLGLSVERFYVFNIADAAVTVGVILLLIFYPLKKHEAERAAEEAAAEAAVEDAGPEQVDRPKFRTETA
jgi:signal peptidase II